MVCKSASEIRILSFRFFIVSSVMEKWVRASARFFLRPATSRVRCLPLLKEGNIPPIGRFFVLFTNLPHVGVTSREVSLPPVFKSGRHRGNNRPTGSQVTQVTEIFTPQIYASLASLVSPAEEKNTSTSRWLLLLRFWNVIPCSRSCSRHRFIICFRLLAVIVSSA